MCESLCMFLNIVLFVHETRVGEGIGIWDGGQHNIAGLPIFFFFQSN